MPREITVSVVQLAASTSKEDSLDQVVAALEALRDDAPDLVVFPELATTPYFSVGLKDPAFFDLAEPVPGPTTERIGAVAASIGANVVLPMFEAGDVPGEYYNSAIVLDRTGKPVDGRLKNGTTVNGYRKVYPGDVAWGSLKRDEKYYFRGGPGYPVFDLDFGRIGILICYDRFFAEGYTSYGLQGADLVCVPVASSGYVGDLFVAGLRTHAVENGFFVLGSNKHGDESVEGVESHFYGLSAIVGPHGRVLAQASDQRAETITSRINLDNNLEQRQRIFVYRDRRPELLEL